MQQKAFGTYDAAAREYYNSRLHPTCHNLNRLSRVWLNRTIPGALDPSVVLEVGAGASTVAEVLHARGQSITGLLLQDASSAMLEHSKRWSALGARMFVSQANEIVGFDGTMDLLVAGLADPYNTPEFWTEAARVLRPGGQILMTLPSYEWAVRYRQGPPEESLRLAEFVLDDGQVLKLPSFVYDLSAQLRMLERAGFMLLQFDSLGVDELPAEDDISPKALVFGNDATSVLWGLRAIRMRNPRVMTPATGPAVVG